MSDLKVEYERAVLQLHFSLGHPIGLYAEALEARVTELTSAARELLEATDTLAIAAARHHLRRTLAAEGKGGRE